MKNKNSSLNSLKQKKKILALALLFLGISLYIIFNSNIINQLNRKDENYDEEQYNIEDINFAKFLISNETSNIDKYTTVISIYFTFEKSKHSPSEYNAWNKNMLLSVNAPLVVFTDFKSVDFIRKTRESNSKFQTLFFAYENVWHMMRQLELERDKLYIKSYILDQNKKDPEKKIHNPNLYAVWNLKAFACNKIAQENPFGSSFFIYTDMGAWRKEKILNWPDNRFVKQLNQKLNNKILFGQINSVNNEKNVNINSDIIEGTFYAGNKNAIRLYNNYFYEFHDQRLDEGLFIGKDQTIMNLIAFNQNDKIKDLVCRLNTYKLKCHKDFDQWFFFQYYFAHQKLYFCDDNKLSLLINA